MSPRDPRTLPPFACSVRGCGRALARREGSLACAAGHAFDRARSGYVNLLQPQDRRSPRAGDSLEQVEARRRLAERGVGGALLAALEALLLELALSEAAWLLEVGSGPGVGLARFADSLRARAVGLDLSVAAIERAARLAPGVDWVVANADRRLPFLDHSLDCLLSVAAPKNPAEFRRVLRAGAHAIVAVPAHDDLIELRGAVQGEARAIERADASLSAFGGDFELVERRSSRERLPFDASGLHDLLLASYRGGRTREAERAAALESLDVTLSSEILLLRAR